MSDPVKEKFLYNKGYTEGFIDGVRAAVSVLQDLEKECVKMLPPEYSEQKETVSSGRPAPLPVSPKGGH